MILKTRATIGHPAARCHDNTWRKLVKSLLVAMQGLCYYLPTFARCAQIMLFAALEGTPQVDTRVWLTLVGIRDQLCGTSGSL